MRDDTLNRQTPRGRRGRAFWLALVGVLCLSGLAGEAAAAAADPLVPNSPIAISSSLGLTDPFSAEQVMFEQAQASGASMIRLDLELAGVFGDPDGRPDWGWLNQYVSLAGLYHLRVLAIIDGTPAYMAACPPGTAAVAIHTCPPADLSLWARDVGEIAAHLRGTINDFEIINEPDGQWSFLGSPQEYAEMLSASYEAIHAANPTAQVALGGLMHVSPAGESWMNQVLATPGADAIQRFDIANIHVRGWVTGLATVVCRWRGYFASHGFRGPLWVTETGYPAAQQYQNEPGFQSGPRSQSAWMARAIPDMISAGASRVFVTERDEGGGRFASEGILKTPDPLLANPMVVRRPSFYEVSRLAERGWPSSSVSDSCSG